MINSDNNNKVSELRHRVEGLSGITKKKMFGYDCYCVKGKFFVGFNVKDESHIILRLEKNEQHQAIKNPMIKPFSHGAKAGWIEIQLLPDNIDDSALPRGRDLYKWIKKSYVYALRMANQE